MRYSLIIHLVIVLLLGQACEDSTSISTKGNAFKLSGNITDQDTGKVYLLKYGNESYERIDSTQLKKGFFSFNGTINIPQRFYIQLAGQERRAAFFMKGGSMDFSATADSIKGFTIIGSSLQDAFNAYEARHKAGKEVLAILSRQLSEAKIAEDDALTSTLKARGDSLYEAGFINSRQYVQTNGQSPVAAYVLYRDLTFDSDYKSLDSLYNYLDSSILNVPYAEMVAERIALLKTVAVGQSIKHFRMQDSSGVSLSTQEFTGQYLLIDFWASWCIPCRQENPNVVDSYNRYHDKGFEILGVSLDTDRGKWLKAINDDGLIWPHVSDLKGWNSSAGKRYGVKSIPHTVLVDPSGTIIARGLRGESLRVKLEELFGKIGPSLKDNKPGEKNGTQTPPLLDREPGKKNGEPFHEKDKKPTKNN